MRHIQRGTDFESKRTVALDLTQLLAHGAGDGGRHCGRRR
jgi:hypothetical protein